MPDELKLTNGRIAALTEMIFAINTEFRRGFSYTIRFRGKNNGNGGRLYAGLPKKQE